MAAATFRNTLSKNWRLQSSGQVSSGEEISKPDYLVKDWYECTVPSTVLGTLVQHNVYRDPYFGTNLNTIPKDQFEKSWWYRREFDLSKDQTLQKVFLHFNGINYRADIWLNGHLIAGKDMVFGAYRTFQFNISEHILPGNNVLAVEVIPPKPGDFSVGFVDWNVDPPDNNMGLFREVTLLFNNGVSIEKPFAASNVNLTTLREASLQISSELANHSLHPVTGALSGRIGSIHFAKEVNLLPDEIKRIEFSPEEFSQLIINDPRLWWPNNLGDPNLYELELSFEANGKIFDTKTITFGIRQVEDYMSGGHRGYKINGRSVLIKGAGWTDDLLLKDTKESLEAQITYVKHMNLNCIRLEGIWGKDHILYDLCDQHGILMMVGWSCHWEHEQYLGKPVDETYGGVVEKDDIELIAESWQDQVLWLRNHPSIFVWTVASDFLPHPDLERKYVEIFKEYDSGRPYLNSTGGVGSEQAIITSSELISEVSGSSGVKMLGPYAYTPPIYWFTDKNLGGAYGFNTETGPGANVPPLQSIKKMIPESNLWPVDEVWEFHCGKNAFRKLDRIQKATQQRYGVSNSVEEFARKSQLLNYELMRPMFEAFQVNKPKATGVIQWMLNSAWPSMYWQLYDSFLMPNGAFYATKKACEPLHLIYHYGEHAVYFVNDHSYPIKDHRCRIRIYDIDSSVIFDESLKIDSDQESSMHILGLPEDKNFTRTYFLDMRLYDDQNRELGNNFYWLSTKRDVLDYDGDTGSWSFHTPSKQYGDFRLLNELPEIQIKVTQEYEVKNSHGHSLITVKNETDNIAFFIYLDIVDDDRSILPILMEDNYVTLLPNEQREINASFSVRDLKGRPELKVEGWNCRPVTDFEIESNGR